MTDTQTFHFAVKPGCEPVQLPSLSAHDRLPWVARGYEVFDFIEGHLGLHPEGSVVFSRLWKLFGGLDEANAAINCVAKSASKSGSIADEEGQPTA